MKKIGLKIVPFLDFANLKKEFENEFKNLKLSGPIVQGAPKQLSSSSNVDKFRLQSSKQLMKQGFQVEKERRASLKKVFNSQLKVRELEMANAKKQSIFITKYGQAVEAIKKNTSVRMQAFSKVVGGAVSSVSGGLLGGLVSFIKNSWQRAIDLYKGKLRISGRLTGTEQTNLGAILATGKDETFTDSIERQRHLARLSTLKADLKESGIGLGQDGSKLAELTKMAVKLVEIEGVKFEEAVSMIQSAVSGNIGSLHNIARQFEGQEGKYTERETEQFSKIMDMNKRFTEISEIHKLLKNVNLPKVKSEKGGKTSWVDDPARKNYETALASKKMLDQKLDQAAQAVSKISAEVIDFFQNPLGKLKSTTDYLVKNMLEGITKSLNSVVVGLKEGIGSLGTQLKEGFKNMMPDFRFWKKDKKNTPTPPPTASKNFKNPPDKS